MAAIPYEYSPIVLAAPAPFCDVKLLILCGSMEPLCGILPDHSKTRSQKLPGLAFQLLTALDHASLEALGARSVDSTLLTPSGF
jgi:hypothetical protein